MTKTFQIESVGRIDPGIKREKMKMFVSPMIAEKSIW